MQPAPRGAAVHSGPVHGRAHRLLWQAASHKLQATSRKLCTWLWTKMNVFVGCLIWKAIWCGENDTFLLFVTFSSIVKKPRFSVYPTRSGKPKDAQDSTRVQIILGVFFLTFCQSFDSSFKVIIQPE